MPSLQDLLNPLSSGPPTPVMLVEAPSSTRSSTRVVEDESSPERYYPARAVVELAGDQMEGMELENEPAGYVQERSEEEEDGFRVEEDVEMNGVDGDHVVLQHQHEPDPMETESDRPALASDESEGDEYRESEAAERSGHGGSHERISALKLEVGVKEERGNDNVMKPDIYSSPSARASTIPSPSPPSGSNNHLPIEHAPSEMPPKKSKKKPPAKKRGQAKTAAAKKRASTVDVDITDNDGEHEDTDMPFPKKSKKFTSSKPKALNGINTPKYDKDSRELYCICRKPDTGKWMIGCDGCEDWYHGECIKVKEEDGDLIDKFYCINCASPAQQTTWKRKCRLPDCRRPAAVDKNPPSKYCSPSHGVDFMSLQVARSTLSRSEIATLAYSANSAEEFKRFGDRIPSPPPSDSHYYPEELTRLSEISAERSSLEARKRMIEQRAQYLALAQERKNRVLEELKADPEAGKVTAICGYDERLALDDMEWNEWCESDDGQEIFEKGTIPGREGVCIKKGCRGHRGWTGLFAEENQVMERLRAERLVALRQEERKIRERGKRRAVKDPREGSVEVET